MAAKREQERREGRKGTRTGGREKRESEGGGRRSFRRWRFVLFCLSAEAPWLFKAGTVVIKER